MSKLQKKCNSCKEIKLVEDFHNCKKYGKKASCKVCRNKQTANPSGTRKEQRALAKEGKKRCTKCKDILDLTIHNFSPSSNPSGWSSHCKPCRSEQKTDPETNYYRHIKHKYGLTKERYQHMFKVQGGRCAICLDPARSRLYVDHCHDSGDVRGLLCHSCNTGLGAFKDDIHILSNAGVYLMGEMFDYDED